MSDRDLKSKQAVSASNCDTEFYREMGTLEKLDLFNSMEVLFPEYCSRIFPYHGTHFYTMELEKTNMEI